jgi:hypothetical protein
LCIQYINLYSTLNLEEEKMQLLRDWFTQVQNLKQQSQQPAMQQPMPAQGPNQAPPTQAPAAPIGPSSGVQI